MISFFLPCIPRGQSRARHTRTGIAYKSADQKLDEQTLQALMLPHRPKQAMAGAVSITMTAVMPVPVSKSGKWKTRALHGIIKPTGKPDLDNICKNVVDCLVSMRFLKDDKLICRLEANKKYGEEPGYHIRIEEL